MNKLFPTVILFTAVLLINSCRREKDQTGCKACTAKYNGTVIATGTVCNAEEEDAFRSSHYYTVVECNK